MASMSLAVYKPNEGIIILFQNHLANLLGGFLNAFGMGIVRISIFFPLRFLWAYILPLKAGCYYVMVVITFCKFNEKFPSLFKRRKLQMKKSFYSIPWSVCSTDLLGFFLQSTGLTTVVKASQVKCFTCHSTQDSQYVGSLAIISKETKALNQNKNIHTDKIQTVLGGDSLRLEQTNHLLANLWKSQWINWRWFSSERIWFKYPTALANSRLSIISLGLFSTVCI